MPFCSRYLQGVQTREDKSKRNNDDDCDETYKGLPLLSFKCRGMSKKKEFQPESSTIEQAHSYVLVNCDEVQVYAKEHFELVYAKNQHMLERVGDIHRKEFNKWFAENVSRHLPNDINVANDLRYLSRAPSMWVKTMTKVTCHGYRWRMKAVDKKSVTQNSGVFVNANTDAGDIRYYGVLTEIIELAYPQGRSIVLFRCDWVDPIRGIKHDELGFTLVNLKRVLKTNEPFILASQASQVFYTSDPKEKNWNVATNTKPRDLFEMEDDTIPEIDCLQMDMSSHLRAEELNIIREDVVGVILDEPLVDLLERNNVEVEAECDSSDEKDDTLYYYDYA